jgi:tetratricopeptide (TPR) repeat protein
MDAKKHLLKAIELDANYAEAYYELGLLLKDEGDLKKSLESFQKAVNLKNDFAEAQCELGIALTKDGEHESARNHF